MNDPSETVLNGRLIPWAARALIFVIHRSIRSNILEKLNHSHTRATMVLRPASSISSRKSTQVSREIGSGCNGSISRRMGGGGSKTKSPRLTLRSNGDKSGMGVRHALFPVPTLGAFPGRRLPDAILHGKRSLRPRSRAVQRFATTGF
jgi:hypothetical protein